MKNKYILTNIIFILFISCSQKAALIPKDRLGDGISRNLYMEINYDKYGRPVFKKKVNSKSETETYYYIVDTDSKSGKLVRFFKIYYIKQKNYKIILSNQPALIYKWTGKGFDLGLKIGSDLINEPVYDVKAIPGLLAIYVTSPIIGTAGGFMYGVHNSVIETWNQVQKPFIKYRELLLGYTKAYYDKQKRLTKLIHYTPEQKPQSVIETCYFYHKEDTHPFKTVTYSIPEKMKRIIQNKR